VVNPINVMLTPEEVLFVVKDCGAKVILASQAKGSSLASIKGDSPLQEIILFGDDVGAGARSFNQLIDQYGPAIDPVDTPPGSHAQVVVVE
jgi:long-chain acyl-CoA synthetase